MPDPHHLPYSGNPVLALAYCYLIQGKCLTVRNDLPFEMQYVCEVDCKPVCLQPCQPCYPPCRAACDVKICPPPSCSCCPPSTQPCDPCCPPACSPAPCAPCPPCPPCGQNVTIVEPACRPNVPKCVNWNNCFVIKFYFRINFLRNVFLFWTKWILIGVVSIRVSNEKYRMRSMLLVTCR